MNTVIYSSKPKDLHLQRAFTLLELLVTIALLAFCAFLTAPGLAGTSTRSRNLQCLNNQRQIMTAMFMYTEENSGFFPPNPDDGNSVAGHNWCPGQAGPGGANEYDPAILQDPRKNFLAAYVKKNSALFRCPADPRHPGRANGDSTQDPALAGRFIPVARSISMNQAVGTVCAAFKNGGSHSGKPVFPVNGSWLNNSHSHLSGQPYRTYGKVSDIVAPSPAGLWVLLDESYIGLNDAGFAFGMNTAEWIDFPSTAHDMACTFAFADGHTELHKWVDPRTRVIQPMRTPALGSPDWLWMSQHTSARAQ